MNLEIKPISVCDAYIFFDDRKCVPANEIDDDLAFAISVVDEKGAIHGVISMNADGKECSLAHLYTDGTALVGSILYGAAWRACKALGYKSICI